MGSRPSALFAGRRGIRRLVHKSSYLNPSKLIVELNIVYRIDMYIRKNR